MDDRQKKIEAGKRRLARYRKKQKCAAALRSPCSSSDASIPSSRSENSVDENTFEALSEKQVNNMSLNLDKGSLDINIVDEANCSSPNDLSENQVNNQGMSLDLERSSLDINIVDEANCSSPNDDQHTEHLGTIKDTLEDVEDGLSTEDFGIVQLYGYQIQQFKDAVKTRDGVISQLSHRLEVAIKAQQLTQQKRDEEVEMLLADLNIYKQQIQQTNEILAKQKTKNGFSVGEILEAQRKIVTLEEENSKTSALNMELAEKLAEAENQLKVLSDMKKGLVNGDQDPDEKLISIDQSVQVESDIISGFGIVDLKQQGATATLVEIGIQTDPLDIGSSSESALQLLTNKEAEQPCTSDAEDQPASLSTELEAFSVPLVHERICSLSSDCSTQNWQNQLTVGTDKSLKMAMNRIIRINNIAKTVNYLLGTLSTFREIGSSQDSNRSLGKVSGFSELNINQHSSLPPNCVYQDSNFIMERFRDEEFAHNMSDITEFLTQEMEQSFCRFNTSLDESKSIELQKSETLSEGSLHSDDNGGGGDLLLNDNANASQNLKESSGLVAQELSSFMSNIQELSDWVNSFSLTKPKEESKDDLWLEEEENIFLQEMPFAEKKMVSLAGSESSDSFEEESDDKMCYEVEKGISPKGRDVSSHLYTIHEDINEEQALIPRYEKHISDLKAQHITDIENIKQSMQSDHAHEKKLLIEKLKNLEQQNQQGLEMLQNLQLFLSTTVKEVQEDYETKTAGLAERLKLLKDKFSSMKQVIESKHTEELISVKNEMESKHQDEKCKLSSVIEALQGELEVLKQELSKCVDEKFEIDNGWRNKIADLVAEHNQDSKNMEEEFQASLRRERKVFEDNKKQAVRELTEACEKRIEEMKNSIEKCVDEKTTETKQNYEQILLNERASHTEVVNSYQKKVEELLQERCQLLQSSKEQYEAIVTQNQNSLKELCEYIQSQISEKVEHIDAKKSEDSTLGSSFIETLNDLNQKLQNGINFLMKRELADDETSHLSSDVPPRWSVASSDSVQTGIDVSPMNVQEMQKIISLIKSESQVEINKLKEEHEKNLEVVKSCVQGDCERKWSAVVENLKQDFEKKIAEHQEMNEKELQVITGKLAFLQESNKKLQMQLQDTEAHGTAGDQSVRPSITSEASTDIHSWQVQAAQTNGRLLHVLSDLVTTFIDIEHDINTRLTQLGLMGSPSEMLGHHEDDTGQSVGSREDFTGLGCGEGHLELHEDGPDLSPRAWDLFTSMGAYEAETEGEDVVISASKKLRLAVDHVLNLLSLALEKHKEPEFKSLLKRNEDLSHELQEESQDKDNLQMDLIEAKSLIRKYESDKHKLEDENFRLSEERANLFEEVSSLKLKVSQLDDERERSYEEKKQLREQIELLSSRLGDPQKMPSGNENVSREVPELLQENSRLSSEKVTIQKSLSKERHNLQSRVQQLELTIEELTAERDDLAEKSRREVEDLRSQIDAMEKQLQSNRKFINEQAVEREQEREESSKEIRKMYNLLKEKEKVQIIENQSKREAEALEQQLKTKIEDHKAITMKKEEVERELRQALDKIHDLREVITELEEQLVAKSRETISCEEKLGNVMKSLSIEKKHNEDLKCQLTQYSSSVSADESLEKIRSLEEQLTSKSQELQQMSQSETLLRELRGQIHFLEAKVVDKIRAIESLQLVPNITSPVMSDDASHSESQDAEVHQVPRDDGFEMSPRSVHWLEIRHLEERMCLLMQICEELVKQNKNMSAELKNFRKVQDEAVHDREVLQQQCRNQLIQISALKSHIDDLNHRTQPPVSMLAVADMDKLKESLQNERDQRKALMREEKQLKEKIYSLETKLLQSDATIRKLEKETKKLPTCRSKSVQTLNSGLSSTAKESISIVSGEMEVDHRLMMLERSAREKDELILQQKQKIVELEGEVRKAKGELEIEQNQLEKDFNTVQDMVQKKEQELCTLQEETENQLCLEASLIALRKRLDEKQSIEQELLEKMKELELRLEEEKQSHAHDVDMWRTKTEEISQRYASEQDALQKQITALKEDLFGTTDFNDIEIKQIQEKILAAADKLKQLERGDSEHLFKQIVYKILEQAVHFKVSALKKQSQMEIDTIHKSWSQKFEEDSLHMRQHTKDQLKKDLINMKVKNKEEIQHISNALKQKYIEEMQLQLGEKDKYWQEKLKQMELSLNAEKVALQKLLSADGEMNSEVAKKVEEVKKLLEDKHSKEVTELKNKIDQLAKDKDTSELALNNLHEREKAILLKEFETKFLGIRDQMRIKFNEEKQELEASYQKQMQELQQELNAKLDKERQRLIQHRQFELDTVRSIFEKQWESEMEKFRELHSKEIKSIQENTSKNTQEAFKHLCTLYEKKVKSIQSECAAKISEEREQNIAHWQGEIQKLQRELVEKFEKEKQQLLAAKEQKTSEELKKQQQNREYMERVESRELENLARNMKVLEERWQKKMSDGQKNLVAAHKAELSLLKRNFELQLQSEKEQMRKIHEDRIRDLQEQFARRLSNSNEIIKALKATSVKTRIDFVRTPSSEVNSSDTCSSCVRDLSPSNQERLVKKIRNDSKDIHSKLQDELNAEIHHLLEEREWILSKLKQAVTSDGEEYELKHMVDKAVSEILMLRKLLNDVHGRDNTLCKQIMHLQNQTVSQGSEICSKLDQQMNLGSQLEEMINMVRDSIPALRELEATAPHSMAAENGVDSVPSLENVRAGYSQRGLHVISQGPEISQGSPYFIGNIDEHKVEQLHTAIFERDRKIKELSLLLENSRLALIPQTDSKITRSKMVSASTPLDFREMGNNLNRNQLEVKDKCTQTSKEKKSAKNNFFIAQVHSLICRFHRMNRYRKALVFQKKYLLTLLSDYQATEEMTLALLGEMGVYLSRQQTSPVTKSSSQPNSCKGRFRCAAFAVVAILRMNRFVSKWRNSAMLPPTHTVERELVNLVKVPMFKLPIIDQRYLAHSSSSSFPSAEEHNGCRQLSNRSSQENVTLNIRSANERPLEQNCVDRLEQLHRQLGIRRES